MKMSGLFGATLHTAPGSSESAGHRQMLRAGMVRQLAQGIFSYLPLGWRSVRKIERILREEMAAVGGQAEGAPGGDRLVVGVGVEADDGPHRAHATGWGLR